MKFAVVIPTMNRPDEIRQILGGIAEQAPQPNAVVVVDASESPQQALEQEFPGLPLRVLAHQPPSAAGQRNRGIRETLDGVEFVMLLDDDLVLEDGAFGAMASFWQDAAASVAGAGFNFTDLPPGGGWWRRSRMLAWLGLYPSEPGGVARSGWHAAVATRETDVDVAWLPTTAAVWRVSAVRDVAFDPFFHGYSYLEDLDFSFSISRTRTLTVVAAARFRHLHSLRGRIGGYRFGRMEVRNRLHVVRKHGLSTWRCWLAIWMRLGLTLAGGVVRLRGASFGRAWGNFVSMLRAPFAAKPRRRGGANGEGASAPR